MYVHLCIHVDVYVCVTYCDGRVGVTVCAGSGTTGCVIPTSDTTARAFGPRSRARTRSERSASASTSNSAAVWNWCQILCTWCHSLRTCTCIWCYLWCIERYVCVLVIMLTVVAMYWNIFWIFQRTVLREASQVYCTQWETCAFYQNGPFLPIKGENVLSTCLESTILNAVCVFVCFGVKFLWVLCIFYRNTTFCANASSYLFVVF